MNARIGTVVVVLLGTACGGLIDPLDPAVGEPIQERCVNQDSDPSTPVSFSEDIQGLIRAMPGGCGCHLPTSENPIGLEQTGLSLDDYESLRAGGNNSKLTIVVPGFPCESVLWQKVSAGPPFGSRMPFNGPPFLDETKRRLIADWIAEGARDN